MVGRDFTGWSERMLSLFVNDAGYRVVLRARSSTRSRSPARRAGRAAPRLQARAGEPDPELQAAHLAVDVPARREGPAGAARHAGEPRRGAVLGHRCESEFCPLPAELRVHGLEAVRGLLVPLSPLRRAGRRADHPRVQVVHGARRARRRDDAAGGRRRDVRRQPADHPRPVRRALAGREHALRAARARAQQGVPAAPVAAGVDHAGRVRRAEDGPRPSRPTATGC